MKCFARSIMDSEENCVEKVIGFLRSRGIAEEVMENFKSQKMDIEAVRIADDEVLGELGLTAKGDVLSLKAFCQRQVNPDASTNDYEDRKRKLVEELRKGKQVRNKERSAVKSDSSVKTIKTRKVMLGWMNYSAVKERFVTVRLSNGGGVRQVDIPGASNKSDLIAEGKKLFFPDGISSAGNEIEMVFDIASFKGENLNDAITVDEYVEKNKLTKTRLYLTSKKKETDTSNDVGDEGFKLQRDNQGPARVEKLTASCQSAVLDLTNVDSDDDDRKEAQSSRKRKKIIQDKGRLWRMKYANVKDDSSESDSDNENKVENEGQEEKSVSALLGTSKEREVLKQQQNKAFQISLDEDRSKKEEMERLESKRAERASRVSPEPEVGTERVRIAVHHFTKGKIVRFFKKEEQMISVYDWVGSQSPQPEHFILCLSPGEEIHPYEPVPRSHTALYMKVTDTPVAISGDESIFFKGYGPDDVDASCLDDTLLNFLDPSQGLTASIELEAKRADAFEALEENTATVYVSKDNIVKDLMSAYIDENIIKKKVNAVIDSGDACGDGVVHEMYSLFWDGFLREFKTEGNTQFAIPVDPNLSPEDYIIVGRIITHQFIQCGTFPVRLAKASVIQMLFGAVDDDCLVDSFLKMFPPKERNTLQTALSGHDDAFPALTLLDILEDYGIKDIPSPKNIKSLLLGIANTELVAKPYFCLQKLKEGMGTFWQEVTSEEIGLLYDVSHPTAERVIASLVLIPQDEKEQQIYRWLQRYLSCSSEEIIVNFLRFCTAMDVILPHVSIAVDVELMMPGVFVRPKAFTCFKKLILPRNYQSFYEMRNNLDKYLRDPLLWDLAD